MRRREAPLRTFAYVNATSKGYSRTQTLLSAVGEGRRKGRRKVGFAGSIIRHHSSVFSGLRISAIGGGGSKLCLDYKNQSVNAV
jgi:hypothetical protein